MAAVMNWFNGQWHKDKYEKHTDEPEAGPSSSEQGLQRSSGYAAEVATAYQRVMYLKERYFKELQAIRCRQVRATGAEAAALQEMDKQHWAIVQDLNLHKARLLIANDWGLDIDFDAAFWREHKKLLLELPESLLPAFAAAKSDACQERTTSTRRREHRHAPLAGV